MALTRERLHVGVAGCGSIARQVHLPLLARRPDATIVALAESDTQALGDAARRHPGARVFRDVDDMLRDAELDAVIVALPPALHASAACAVFDAGLHLYLEKPLAPTLDEAAAIVQSWRRSGRIGVMGFNCRANPLHLRLRELMHAERAGSVAYLRTFLSSAARPLPEWKRLRDSGGGVLLDLGVHHIDLIRFLTGREIAGVRASVSSRMSEHDTALVELELEGGIGAHAFFSLCAAEGDEVEVHGSLARMSVARYTSLDVHVTDNPGRGGGAVGRLLRGAGAVRHLPRALKARRAPMREPGYAELLDRFVRAARAGVAPVDAPDIADGFAATAVVAAAESSLATGQMEAPASLSDLPERLLEATP